MILIYSTLPWWCLTGEGTVHQSNLHRTFWVTNCIAIESYMLFDCSHVGADVRLLDPPEHVSDPEVPGYYWRCHFSCWKPHAGPKSCQEVRPLMTSAANGSQRVLKPREALCPTPDKKESGLSASWPILALNPENTSAWGSSAGAFKTQSRTYAYLDRSKVCKSDDIIGQFLDHQPFRALRVPEAAPCLFSSSSPWLLQLMMWPTPLSPARLFPCSCSL